MGRNFLSSVPGFPFGSSTNLATFHVLGNVLVLKQSFITSKNTSGTSSTRALTTSGGIPSGPGAFLGRSLLAAA
jgi:hypothetical protein